MRAFRHDQLVVIEKLVEQVRKTYTAAGSDDPIHLCYSRHGHRELVLLPVEGEFVSIIPSSDVTGFRASREEARVRGHAVALERVEDLEKVTPEELLDYLSEALTKEAPAQAEWRTRLSFMVHSEGFDYPVFQWIHGDDPASSGDYRTGLTAWPLQGTFHLQLVSGEDFRLQTVEQVRSKLRELDWSEPEHLEMVAGDIYNCSQEVGARGVFFKMYQIFGPLHEKWAKIAQEKS
jgi:hypothetical protein